MASEFRDHRRERESMSGEPAAGSARLSRRSLLGGAIGAVGILSATANLATAQPKISKVAVNYQDHPDGNKRCDKCVQFQPPDACKVVEGAISPQGSCRIFVPGHTRS
jgi:hypothetical protein